MSETAKNTPRNGAQTVETPTVEETNAAAVTAQKTQNTGSKPHKQRKRLSLTEKILEIRKRVAPHLNICIPLTTELDKAKIEEMLAAGPVGELRAADPSETVTPASAFDLLLTTLNTYAVDWRIVSETAAQHDANGSALYCRTYNLTASKQTLWLYEAELDILLVNVDNPDETESTELHAVGTSTKSVKDARAAALRNCLVSFFASRFNAPQIAQNDTNDGGGEIPAAAQSEANRAQTGAQGEKQEPRPLSDPQINRLYRKAEAAGCTKEQVAEYVLENYGKKALNTMTREEYDAVCKYYDENRQPIGR